MNEGMARTRIVPFRCEECGGEFAEPAGGLCRPCGRLLCRKHLTEISMVSPEFRHLHVSNPRTKYDTLR